MPQEFEPCISIPGMPGHGETNTGRSFWSSLWNIAAAALAVANALASAKMAAEQLELAELYLRIARNWRDWYNAKYKPLEDQELAEIWAETPAAPHYDAAVGRALATARFLLRNRLFQRMRGTPQYATGLRGAFVVEETIIQGQALAASAALGWRNEEARLEARDDRRWKRREAAVNRGRDLMADNISYGRLAMNVFGDLADQAGQAAAGLVYGLAYNSARRDTYMPTYSGLGYDGRVYRTGPMTGAGAGAGRPLPSTATPPYFASPPDYNSGGNHHDLPAAEVFP